MTKRITWSQSEREALYHRMVDIIAEGKWVDNRNILRYAQEVLPTDRRRKVTDGMVFNYKSKIALAKSEAQTRARDRKLTEVALQKPAPAPAPAPAELSLGELFERLVTEVTRRVTAEVRKALAEQQTAPAPSPTGVNNSRERLALLEAPSQRVRKTSVLIIGLNGQQVTLTKQNHPDLDIICFTAEDAQSRAAIRADYTVLMTKFINHGTQSKYRHVPNLRYCNGGVSDLAHMLQMIKREAA